jgi:hypothetical protein
MGCTNEQAARHLRRHDFSRWIEDVFRDRPLATHLRGIEAHIQTGDAHEIAEAIAQAIRARYETTAERATASSMDAGVRLT